MERTLTLSRPLATGANAFLEVRVGPLAAGHQVRVTTPSGALLGTIAPFGPAARGSGGVYTLSVPADAIRNESLSVRVSIEEGSKPARTPTAAEVQGLTLVAPGPAQ